MKVIKRNKNVENFDIIKIIGVLHKANNSTTKEKQTPSNKIVDIANKIKNKIEDEEITAEQLEDIVEETLIEENCVSLAKSYILGCYEKKKIHYKQDLDDSILGIIDNKNEEVAKENANKDPDILSTQRDYIAGEVSKDLVKRVLMPKEVIEAHEKAIIHVHDMDYIAMRIHNCELLNIKDMLENGTVISGVKIDTPKSLSTAATVMTQISAQVASSSYGGQSINLAHIAPFVDISRKKIKDEVYYDLDSSGIEDYDDESVDLIVERRLRKEIKDSIQTMQYQWSTISSTNGQTPFISLFMYLDDAQNEQEKHDLALLIEEVLNQRIKGIKNEEGIYVSPTFPKLIYVLDEDNITRDSKYFWLTELAAKCTAKRLVPDYISAKKMKELKGSVYAPMGK